MGTQKNRLNETGFFEHPKLMLKLMGKIIFTILRSNSSVLLDLYVKENNGYFIRPSVKRV